MCTDPLDLYVANFLSSYLPCELTDLRKMYSVFGAWQLLLAVALCTQQQTCHGLWTRSLLSSQSEFENIHHSLVVVMMMTLDFLSKLHTGFLGVSSTIYCQFLDCRTHVINRNFWIHTLVRTRLVLFCLAVFRQRMRRQISAWLYCGISMQYQTECPSLLGPLPSGRLER